MVLLDFIYFLINYVRNYLLLYVIVWNEISSCCRLLGIYLFEIS